MSRLLFLAVAVAAALPVPAFAQGRAGDRAWATCVWQTAPRSAANWLAMAAPAWTDNLATPAERLGHRLIAICANQGADERRPNRNPRWSALMSSLRGARPREPGGEDRPAPATLLCAHHVRSGGAGILYRIDIVRAAAGGERLITFQQYFLEHQGRSLRAPQDIRHLPAAGAELSVECRAITAAGALADA